MTWTGAALCLAVLPLALALAAEAPTSPWFGTWTLRSEAASPTGYGWTYAVADWPLVQGVDTLSADRRSFRQVSWSVTRPAEIVTLIDERQ